MNKLRSVAAIIALLSVGVADAQTADIAWNAAKLTWLPVTRDVNQNILTGTVSYRIWAAQSGGTKTVVATITSPGTLRTNIPEGTWCWQISAVVGNLESDKSPEMCKEIKRPPPTVAKPATVTDFSVE